MALKISCIFCKFSKAYEVAYVVSFQGVSELANHVPVRAGKRRDAGNLPCNSAVTETTCKAVRTFQFFLLNECLQRHSMSPGNSIDGDHAYVCAEGYSHNNQRNGEPKKHSGV